MERRQIIGLGIIIVGIAGAALYYVYSGKKADAKFNEDMQPAPGEKPEKQRAKEDASAGRLFQSVAQITPGTGGLKQLAFPTQTKSI